jgi:hypothetical protein
LIRCGAHLKGAEYSAAQRARAEQSQSEYQMQQAVNHTPLKIELQEAGWDVACIDYGRRTAFCRRD